MTLIVRDTGFWNPDRVLCSRQPSASRPSRTTYYSCIPLSPTFKIDQSQAIKCSMFGEVSRKGNYGVTYTGLQEWNWEHTRDARCKWDATWKFIRIRNGLFLTANTFTYMRWWTYNISIIKKLEKAKFRLYNKSNFLTNIIHIATTTILQHWS